MGSTSGKISGAANQAAGKAKQAAGKATGSRKLLAEGKGQEVKGQEVKGQEVKGQEVKGKVQSAAGKAKSAVKGAVDRM
ncbi:CsbD family protein [Pararhizobium sp. LjRoot238]|uniref:CsbD family protein n=1 Tax=Pararhizobium sp. LjRoot238 TaxID=3342293 RepID=UPI003ECE9760